MWPIGEKVSIKALIKNKSRNMYQTLLILKVCDICYQLVISIKYIWKKFLFSNNNILYLPSFIILFVD